MGKRILVADDSVTIQRAFAMVFAVEDVSLIAARSWEEAMTLTRQHRPDLVFADVNLGDRSGYDLCSAIKSDGTLAGVQVHILASNQVPYDASKGNHARADGHFLKPFDSAKLVEAVNKALSVSAPVAVERAPAAPMVELAESTSRVQIEDVSFEDEDSYGEFSIESTASAAPPQMKTPPPQVQPPRPMAPAMSRPVPVTPPPVVLPQARPPMPAVSAPVPRPAPPVVSTPVARPSTSMPNVSAPAPAPAPRPAAPLASAPAPRPAPAAPAPSAPITAKAMPRPSLIPGVMPPRVSSDAPVPMVRPPATSGPAPAAADFSRTVMGMPAVSQPVIPVPMPRSEVVTARETPAVKGLGQSLFDDLGLPPSSPQAPAPVAPVAEPPTPIAGRAPTGRISDRVAEQVSAKVGDKLGEKMAELSARGPEYEAIAKLSREIIEQVVWEVVPELAEVMIKEHIERLAKR
ncbi:MAG: response regulator [Deltaproteobacteria bacterium]|nr:response regulator [Deltaproteobacteria bacterium]